MKMKESELVALIQEAKRDAAKYNGDFMSKNEALYRQYMGMPYGDEVEGMSQVVSTDVSDVIESDMPSLARIFLGSHDILQFMPTNGSERAAVEADQKTKYINSIVRNQKNGFKIIHDFIKEALIMKLSVLKFYVEDYDKVDHVEYEGLSQEEIVILLRDFEENNEEVKIEKQDIENGYIKFKTKNSSRRYVIRNVPVEEFLITRNARSKDDADLVGDECEKTKGQLIEEGYDVELVKSLPSRDSDEEGDGLRGLRTEDQGGQFGGDGSTHWTSHRVRIADLYFLVDFDGDGIPERRRIMLCGDKILENEPFGIVPYAINTSVLMPHLAIGRSRAEFVTQTQRVKTVLYRHTLDNIYRVNAGRVVTNPDVTKMDDLLTVRYGGAVRTKGDPLTAVAQLNTPYIGDKTLQIIQYVDTVRAQTTGMTMTNQGIDADRLYKETATRFEGIKDAGAAKTELIARCMAETGFKDLYEGLAWLVAHYQNEPVEIMVTGKPMAIDPRLWRYEHCIRSTVGLAAGDEERQIGNMSGLLSIHQQLSANGSVLTDEKKVYNTLSKIVKAMGANIEDHFNDPTVPEATLQAQVQLLQQQLTQIQQQMQNPLIEIENLRAQSKIAIEQQKLASEEKRFMIENDRKEDEFNRDKLVELTKMELEYKKNVPGALV